MVSRFGLPDPNWQFRRELARRPFTTRPLPIFNFCTYAKSRQIRIAINRAMDSVRTDTKAAEKHAEFPDIPTEAVPRTRGRLPGGPKAHGLEARKPSHPHGRRQHRLSAGYPFSLIRGIRNPSPSH